jgi:recombination protein RecA
VTQRRPVEVLSYDPAKGTIAPRRVVNWFNNGHADEFFQFEVEGGRPGRRHFAATANHLIFTPSGRARAGDLGVGSEVLVAVEDYELSGDQWQVVLGGAFGDGSLRKAGTHTAHFRVGHGEAQKDYLRWKHAMLAPFSNQIRPTGRGFGFDTMAIPAFADLCPAYYDADRGRIATRAILERIDARGLAVWYADDGSFAGSYARWGQGKAVLYNTALRGESRQHVVAMLERLGLGCPRDDGRGFWFSSEQTARFHALIAPYVHPSVDYKLHPSQRGKFAWHREAVDAEQSAGALAERRRLRAVPARVLKRYVKPLDRKASRYDLEVEGHHTYLVDGVVVHNSPETQPGGRALKFYASVRIDVRRQDAIKQGTESLGVRTKAKVVKNKLAPPFREAEFDMIYGEGISKTGTVLDVGVEQGIIEKSGTWYTYKNERIGQGRENAKRWLQENPTALADLEAKVREVLGLRAPVPIK